jgi:hypothetical protein
VRENASPDLERIFAALVKNWRREIGGTSSSEKIVLSPSYQRIIGLGRAALPLILRDLERRPNHWSWALRAITGENPVPAEAAGDLEAAANAWLEWGRRNNVRW